MADDLTAWWRRRRSDPVFWSGAVQILKTAVAAVIAWLVVRDWLGLSQSFLAPWAAILVVQATVYRTFSDGSRQVAATVVGVLLAWVAGVAVGVGPVSVAVVISLGLAVGALPWFQPQAQVAAATALVVLLTGSTDGVALFDRLADTGIGVLVGLLVNLLVWPPLQRRTAIAAIDDVDDAVGEMLVDMAEGLEQRRVSEHVMDWIHRTRDLDDDLDRAWGLVRQARESARMNPRRSARGLRDPKEWHRLLVRLEQGVAESRSLARTLALAEDGVGEEFGRRWIRLLRETGESIVDADPERLEGVRDGLQELADDGASTDPEHWPVEGALLINLRNIADAFALVTRANPLGRPPLPHERLRSMAAVRRQERRESA